MSEGRKVVLAMPEGRDPLARLAQEERQRQGDRHPPAEQLTAYHAGELAADEAERLQAHLAVCRLCTQALLDLSRFYREAEAPILPASPDPPGIPTTAETEASWRTVRARLAAAERRRPVPPDRRSSLPAVPGERRLWPRFTTSPAAFLGMALSLLSCLIGFPVWIATRVPQVVYSAVVYVVASEVTRGPGNEKEIEVELPGHSGDSLTVVCPVPAPGFATYRMEILALEGKEPLASAVAAPRVRAAPLEPSLRFKLPAGRLAPGAYRLVVRSPRGEPLAEWTLRVRSTG